MRKGTEDIRREGYEKTGKKRREEKAGERRGWVGRGQVKKAKLHCSRRKAFGKRWGRVYTTDKPNWHFRLPVITINRQGKRHCVSLSSTSWVAAAGLDEVERGKCYIN